MIVLPTKRKPRFFRSLLSASDSGAGGRHLPCSRDAVLDRLAADEAPQVPGEVRLLLKVQKRLGIADRGLDLQPIAHDAGIFHQPRDVALAEARDALGIEAGECRAIALALVEDGRPGQPGLRAFQDQELELGAVVPGGHAPLLVVIVDVELVAA